MKTDNEQKYCKYLRYKKPEDTNYTKVYGIIIEDTKYILKLITGKGKIHSVLKDEDIFSYDDTKILFLEEEDKRD